jgi:class 3 adenylate cyclase
MERRLAAIVCADVAGYSRMMGADEAGTHAAFKAHRSAIYPIILNHGGRLVKNTATVSCWSFQASSEPSSLRSRCRR